MQAKLISLVLLNGNKVCCALALHPTPLSLFVVLFCVRVLFLSLVKYRLPNWIKIVGFTPSLVLRSSTCTFGLVRRGLPLRREEGSGDASIYHSSCWNVVVLCGYIIHYVKITTAARHVLNLMASGVHSLCSACCVWSLHPTSVQQMYSWRKYCLCAVAVEVNYLQRTHEGEQRQPISMPSSAVKTLLDG